MNNNNEVKISPQISAIIWCLQNDWLLFTYNAFPIVDILNDSGQSFTFSSLLLQVMVSKGLLHQDPKTHRYFLTQEAEQMQVKEPDLNALFEMK